VCDGALCSPLEYQASTWSIAENLMFATKTDTGRDMLNDEESRAVGNYWAMCAQAEHASVASFARHTLELMAVGAPPTILQTAQKAGVEEVGHAQLCFALAKKYGVVATPGPFPLPASSTTSLVDMTVGVATEGCVAEFGSCIVACLQAARAEPPAVKRALEQIAKEEAGHCVLAWRTLIWALGRLSSEQTTGIAKAFDTALKAEDSAVLMAQAEPVTVLETVAKRFPRMGLLTRNEETRVRAFTSQNLTRTWAAAVLGGHRPPAPTLDSVFTPALAQIHQAIFYQEPLLGK